MKRLTLSLSFLLMVFFAMAQTSSTLVTANNPKLPALDQSPMDMAYFPADYPILKTQNKVSTPPVARIIYGRPQRNDREVFGELIAYDKIWRLGANEATEIEFFKEVTIDGKKIAKGRYTLYAIPSETRWTIIINKDTDTWGAFVYDPAKDVLRTDVAVTKLDVPVEPFSMVFNPAAKGASLVIAWESVSVSLPIEFK